VGGKATHNATLPKPQKVAKEPEHPEPEHATVRMKEEDHTFEKQVALSSPMKGSKSGQAGKVCYTFSHENDMEVGQRLFCCSLLSRSRLRRKYRMRLPKSTSRRKNHARLPRSRPSLIVAGCNVSIETLSCSYPTLCLTLNSVIFESYVSIVVKD
jgi:hypothetical protein